MLVLYKSGLIISLSKDLCTEVDHDKNASTQSLEMRNKVCYIRQQKDFSRIQYMVIITISRNSERHTCQYDYGHGMG